MMVKTLTMLTAVFAVLFASIAAGRDSEPVQPGNFLGSVERFDSRLDAIVPPNARLQVLATGHKWTEGPVWVPRLNALLYSDIPNNAIYRWRSEGTASVWLKPSGYTAATGDGPGSNGLLLDGEGRLVLAQHGDRRLARLIGSLESPQPEFDTLAGQFDGKRFNSPNDIARRSNGDLYFTDPPYGLAQGMNDPLKELGFQGVYRLATDGAVTLLIDDLPRPNGIAFSPDEQVLYVADSDKEEGVIMAYPVEADGGLGVGKVFYETWGDGMAVDQQGNIYVAGPGEGVMILGPDGVRLGSLRTTEPTSNCAFGEDGRTLFITANRNLLRVRLSATGVGF